MLPRVADPVPAARRVRYAGSVDEMLAGATDRQSWKTADSLSGSHFERVTIDGESFESARQYYIDHGRARGHSPNMFFD